MKVVKLIVGFIFLFTLVSAKEKVEFKNDPENKKVDVFIGGKLFTSFIYPDNMEKQILYPILSSSGKIITRGYPLNPRPFERTDHPHQIGLWFNFGDLNGLDFWNNSSAIKPADKPRYGTIRFDKIISENSKKGQLVISSFWVNNDGVILLKEETTFIFSGGKNLRCITRISKLKAEKEVVFNENKEGLIGLRVDRSFEEPSNNPEKFLDSNGNVTEVAVMNNDGVNGVFRNAEGISGSGVWSKRSPWVALKAEKDGEVITIVIIDNPKNLNYPAWSHARGYGLFATNNLGGRAFDKNSEPVSLVLKPGQEVVFKHKVVIGGNLTDAEINSISEKFK
jgi:hypothetical protein